MNLTFYNIALGCCLIIAIIVIDYLRKFNTDDFQRKLMITALCVLFASIVLDLTGHIMGGKYIFSILLITKNISFYFGAVFIDYIAHGNITRTKKLIRVVCVLLGLYAVSVILNLPFGYYFTVSADNVFIRESFYAHQKLFSYVSMFIIIVIVIRAPKQFKLTQGTMVNLCILIVIFGMILDMIFKTTSLIWPCITSAYLYIYFFIIKSNLKVDSLTGIGNRYSFDEFIKRISKQNIKENYSMAIIDIDHFTEINDTLGSHEGDNALRDMAAIIKRTIRQSDIAARYENDEFVLVTSTKDNIQRMIDRIEEALEKQNKLRDRPYQLHMSYGYDIFTTNTGRSIREFLNHVDRLMYKYKEVRRKEIVTVITAKMDDTPATVE